MKKLSIIVALLLGIILVSCSNDLDSNGKEAGTSDLAKVIIPLPNHSSVTNNLIARGVGLEDVKIYTNFFEVLFEDKTSGDTFSANATIDKGYIEATIPPGNYDILLFAGDKDYFSNYDPLLLASSYSQDIMISLEETNTINLILATFDIDITAPSKVIVGSDYTLNINIDTKNPLINGFGSGGFASEIYYGGGPLDHPIDGDSYLRDGNIFTYSVTFDAPLTTGTKSYDFHGSIRIANSTWSYGTTAHPFFGNIFSKDIIFVEGSDVKINISWPE